MAKRKARTQNKPRGRAKGSQTKGISLPRPNWRIVGRVILIVAVVSVLYWQWSNITAWAISVRDETLRLFGWGLLLLTIALVSLGVVTWLRKSTPLMVRFRQWWGGIAFTFAIWGILAYFAFGGS
ncbi:hypothetical protein ACFLWM_01435, partial [Chloroflexota bacterium]